LALLSGHFDLQASEASIDKTNYPTIFTSENDLRQYKVNTAFINNSI